MDETEPPIEGIIRILVVEDNEDDYAIFTQYLTIVESRQVSGWDVEQAPRLTVALELLQKREWDVIVLDLTLPDSSGLDTFRTLESFVPNVPIVVLSGVEDEELALDLVKRGAQDYLFKNNLQPDLIVRTLLHALERKRFLVREEHLYAKLNRERSEVSELQMQLIQAEKLESLGRMAAGVAHEVKNPLSIILGGVDYFSNKADMSETDQTVMNLMRENIMRADRIVSEMVDFSRQYKLSFKPTDPNELIDKALSLKFADLRHKQVDLKLNLKDDLSPVEIDPLKIEQVLVNLIGNAVHALPVGGQLKISTYLSTLDSVKRDEGLRTFDQIRVKDKLLVMEVRDYGTGISQKILGNIFDPFFTTKPTGEGTGLGLSVSRKIVELHHGVLVLENVDPPGIRARILLPFKQAG